jgi:hypothetical protein
MLAAKLMVPAVLPALGNRNSKMSSHALASGLAGFAVIAVVCAPAFLAILAARTLARVLPDIETKYTLRPFASDGSEIMSEGW